MKRNKLRRAAIALTLTLMILPTKSQYKESFYAEVFYELILGGNISNPLHWIITDSHNCPGTGNLCGIDIFNDDVYTLIQATAAGNPAWENCPKVNTSGTQFVKDLLAASVSSTDNQWINGRTYFKRSIP